MTNAKLSKLANTDELMIKGRNGIQPHMNCEYIVRFAFLERYFPNKDAEYHHELYKFASMYQQYSIYEYLFHKTEINLKTSIIMERET